MGMKKLWIKFVNWVKYLFRRPNKALQKGVSLCLLCLGKIKISHISLPENFDLERHKAQYPPQEYGFQHIAFRDFKALYILTYIIHSGFISGYQNRYGDNLKPPTNVYHRMTA